MDRRPPSFFEWLMIYSTIPLAWYLCVTYWESKRPDKNCIKKDRNYLSGVMKAGVTETISMKKAKEVSKKMGATFNDMVMALVSQTLAQYFKQKKDESTYVTASLPFSFGCIPHDHDEYTYGNSFSSCCLYLELKENFDDAIEEARKKSNFLKKSLLPAGFYTMTWLYNAIMPVKWASHIYDTSGKKQSILVSNVPGYVKPVKYFGGCPAKRFISLGTGSGNLATTINVISVTKRAQMTVTSDISQIEDLTAFIEMMNMNIRKLNIVYDPNEEGKD
jgi:hypothetical protein